MAKRAPAPVVVPEITLRIRYTGEDRVLLRFDGQEYGPLQGSQDAVMARLKREIGPLVVISDVEQDGDVAIVTLGDPPKVTAAPVVEQSFEPDDRPSEEERPAKASKASKVLPRRGFE
jgi:hypothetical protein